MKLGLRVKGLLISIEIFNYSHFINDPAKIQGLIRCGNLQRDVKCR